MSERLGTAQVTHTVQGRWVAGANQKELGANGNEAERLTAIVRGAPSGQEHCVVLRG
jgi:hypothetical protein